jgi:hypothetical protein
MNNTQDPRAPAPRLAESDPAQGSATTPAAQAAAPVAASATIASLQGELAAAQKEIAAYQAAAAVRAIDGQAIARQRRHTDFAAENLIKTAASGRRTLAAEFWGSLTTKPQSE